MVERFELDFHGLYGEDAYMAKAENGEFVRYSDYTALEAKLAELAEVVHILSDQESGELDRRLALKDASRILSALEATPPEPKVTDEMVDRAWARASEMSRNTIMANKSALREVLKAALTVREGGKHE